MKNLFLSHNDLEQLPASMADLQALEVLDVSYNQLKNLPGEIARLAALKILDASYNQLEHLPYGVSRIGTLEELHIHHNLLSDLPGGLHGLSRLQRFTLSDNRLDFADIEPLAVLKFFNSNAISYTPQARVHHPVMAGAPLGQPFGLQVPVAGTANRYQWQKNGVDIAVATSATYRIDAMTSGDAAVYTLKITSEICGQLTLFSHDYTLSALCPAGYRVEMSTQGTRTFCEGENIVALLSANVQEPVSGFQWFRNGVKIAGAENSRWVAEQPGEYILQITSREGCTWFSEPVKVQVVRPLTVRIATGNDLLKVVLDDSTGGQRYQWFLNDRAIEQGNEPVYRATASGAYRVKVWNAGGCTTLSDAVQLTITSNPETITPGTVRVYPNPAEGIFYVETVVSKAELKIYDNLGRQVRAGIVREPERYRVDLSLLPVGIYLLEMVTAQGRITKPLVNE